MKGFGTFLAFSLAAVAVGVIVNQTTKPKDGSK